MERIPGKVSGAWLCKGTRVPVKALFVNLEGGARIDEFLERFRGVTREQAEAVLAESGQWKVDSGHQSRCGERGDLDGKPWGG